MLITGKTNGTADKEDNAVKDFTFACPTEVIFGRDAELQAADIARKHGGSRLLVVYGGESAVKSGLIERLAAVFQKAGLVCRLLGGVQPNPRLGFVREAIQTAVEMKADMIIGVGGGSVIDTAKAIAHGAANPDVDIWDFWLSRKQLKNSLPVGAVVTIPAAGSEMSDSAVLTNEQTKEKRGLGTPLNRPALAILNPALAATLPRFQAACGVTDILMHTLDRYFTSVTGNDLTDEIAEALMRVVIRNGRRVVHDPKDYEAMSEIMWCSSVSHNGITGLGGVKDFSVHQLGHAIGAFYDKAHGATLSAVWESWARYVLQTSPERFEKYAKNVWCVSGAEAGIEATAAFFKELGMPVCFSELGIGILPGTALDDLAFACTYGKTRTIGSFKVLGFEDIRCIYTSANR
jgi:alcohol dehydrogenase YqhD (iron-dependent ADH family)